MPKVSVQKNVKLQEGEELMDFVNKVMDAVAQHRQKTERSVFLTGIFKGFIITRDLESGKFFQMKLGRDKEGLIKLGDPIEVRQTFVPVTQQALKSEGDEITTVEFPPLILTVKSGKITDEAVDSINAFLEDMAQPHDDDDFVETKKSDDDEPASFADVLGLQS